MLPDPIKPSVSSVASVGIGVPVGIIVVYVINLFMDHAGLDHLPPEVAAAAGSVVSFLVGLPFNGGRAQDTQ